MALKEVVGDLLALLDLLDPVNLFHWNLLVSLEVECLEQVFWQVGVL
jgi:hypothetical protein